MAAGVRGKKKLEKHQKKKFFRLFPEKWRVAEEEMKIGSETQKVSVKRAPIGKGIVTKEYNTIGASSFKMISMGEMVKRFKLQKELHSAGLPVARPLNIEQKGNRIIWKEQEVKGVKYSDLHDSLLRKVRDREITEKEAKKLEKIENKIEKAVNEITSYLSKHASEESLGLLDLHNNAIWDEKNQRIVFIDIMAWRTKPKK